MKSFAGILFSSIIFFSSLLPSQNLAELSQLSNLEAHFQLHKLESQDQTVSFWLFFWQHYSPFTSSHEHTQDHELPLYNVAPSVVFTCLSSAIKLNNPYRLIKQFYGNYFINNYHFLFVNLLIQPPKGALI